MANKINNGNCRYRNIMLYPYDNNLVKGDGKQKMKMVTIKELEELEGEKPSPKWDSQNIGYYRALEEVLKLIDEMIKDCIKGEPHLEELKQKIKG